MDPELEQTADFKKTDTTGFPDKDETTPESQPETVIEEETPSTEAPATEEVAENQPEDNIPFHKHPRWIQLQEERESDKQKIADLEAKITTPQSTDTPLPDWYVQQYGDSPETRRVWTQAQEYEAQREARIIEQAKEAIRQEATAEQKRISEQETAIAQNLEGLKSEGKAFDEEKLLGIVDEFTPKNPDGTYAAPLLDFAKAYEIYELRNSKPATKAKKVAALSATPSSGAEVETTVKQSDDWYSWKKKI